MDLAELHSFRPSRFQTQGNFPFGWIKDDLDSNQVSTYDLKGIVSI